MYVYYPYLLEKLLLLIDPAQMPILTYKHIYMQGKPLGVSGMYCIIHASTSLPKLLLLSTLLLLLLLRAPPDTYCCF